ncbi:S8 family serine peptidase [Nibrella viscosa]|uniref:S8 family serine peptidase n=1 Tax=Nibrella viscosa TaxID=1084524 RepID=A0ABP8KDS7_9BACT
MAKNKWLPIIIGLFFFSGLSADSLGQVTVTTARKYLVLLKDKANSPFSINRPEQFLSQRAILRRQRQNIPVQEKDLPVNPSYIQQISQTGAKIWFSSRWLNAVLIEATDPQLTAVQGLAFVKGLEFNAPLANARLSVQTNTATPAASYAIATANRQEAQTDKFGEIAPLSYGASQEQITQLGANQMHQKGYRGEGMLIAVLDAGFRNAHQVPFLQPLFQENRIVGTYDFVAKEYSVYEDDSHGLSVLSTIAGTSDNMLYGTAFKASFLLLRTEDARSETRVEEANWLFGAEYADSTGVDIINSSLGYNRFDGGISYSYQDMNGRTALASRAAQWAAEAGMVVVVSAGNEGNDPWKYISVPADADQILAIGAVNRQGLRAPFSSFGPAADGRIKPDLAAVGWGTVLGSPGGTIVTGNGTSFAAPLVAGLAAGFWQAHPRLTAAQIIDCLRRSGSQYATPDAELGYGIPNFERASMVAADRYSLFVFPNPFSDADQLVIHWVEPENGGPIDATLHDVSGRLIWQQRFANQNEQMSLAQNLYLTPGMYFLTLSTVSRKRTIKVVKQ